MLLYKDMTTYKAIKNEAKRNEWYSCSDLARAVKKDPQCIRSQINKGYLPKQTRQLQKRRYWVKDDFEKAKELMLTKVSERPRKVTVEQQNEIVKMYKETNMTQIDIGAKFGITQETTSRILRQHNVKCARKPKKSRKLTIKDEEKIVKLYKDTEMTQLQIAEKIGTFQENVSIILKKHNVECKRKKGEQK